MIDEKKIEEAAKKHMLEQFYSDDDGGDFPCDISDIKSQCMNDFQTGINWFLDNLWHDADERPNKEKTILCEAIDKLNNRLVYVDINLKTEYQDYKTNIDAMRINRWLYIDDLQKGGK